MNSGRWCRFANRPTETPPLPPRFFRRAGRPINFMADKVPRIHPGISADSASALRETSARGPPSRPCNRMPLGWHTAPSSFPRLFTAAGPVAGRHPRPNSAGKARAAMVAARVGKRSKVSPRRRPTGRCLTSSALRSDASGRSRPGQLDGGSTPGPDRGRSRAPRPPARARSRSTWVPRAAAFWNRRRARPCEGGRSPTPNPSGEKRIPSHGPAMIGPRTLAECLMPDPCKGSAVSASCHAGSATWGGKPAGSRCQPSPSRKASVPSFPRRAAKRVPFLEYMPGCSRPA